ncbi:hypothetical protein D3C85_1857620 [compost metagenome]
MELIAVDDDQLSRTHADRGGAAFNHCLALDNVNKLQMGMPVVGEQRVSLLLEVSMMNFYREIRIRHIHRFAQ